MSFRNRPSGPPPPYRTGSEQPADNGPARQDVRAKHLIGWMDHPTDVTDEVTAQRLALSRGQVLSLEPVLVTLLLPKPYLNTGYKLEASSRVTELRGRTGVTVTLEVMNSNLVSMSGVSRQARNFLEVRAVNS